VSLSARLTLVFAAIGFATVATVSGLAWWLAASESRQSVDTDLLRQIESITAIAQRPLAGSAALAEAREQGEVPNLTVEEFNDRAEVTTIRVLADDGLVAGSPVGPPSDAALASLDDADPHLESVTIDRVPYRFVTVPVTNPDAVAGDDTIVGLQLARDVTSERTALSNLATRLVALSVGGVALVITASWIVGRWLTRPIDQLTDTAERLAELDDLPGRVEVNRSDEIGRLAESFNRLMSALEVGREQQRRLVADASHELRTPLTSLRGRIEYLDHRGGHDDETATMLTAAVHDAERLSALVADLVDLATDIRNADEAAVDVELADLVADVAAQVQISSGRTVRVEADDTIATVRPTMVRRALHNLLDNAVKYGGDGAIVVRAADGVIEVHDDGPGIAEDERAHVFDRFYRSPKARSRPGNGIGLAIVAHVADAHDGTVRVGTSDLGGALVAFSVAPNRTAHAVTGPAVGLSEAPTS
jgi:two-component system, OmpR family, sensor histidine kinase MprB